MATDKLFPAFVRIQYHSAKALHTATIPVKGYIGGGIGDMGELENWDAGSAPTDQSVEDFIDLWGLMVDDALVFDRWQLFTVPVVGEPPLWIWEAAHSVTGSATITAGQTFAVQHTMTYRSDVGGIFKHITLDRNSGGFWGRSYIPSGIEQDMIDFITSGLSWIAARDNGRPIAFLRLTVSENDRLAREYHQSL